MTALRILLCRFWCALWGHPDTVIAWGAWQSRLVNGVPLRRRQIREVCCRCRRGLAVSAITERVA